MKRFGLLVALMLVGEANGGMITKPKPARSFTVRYAPAPAHEPGRLMPLSDGIQVPLRRTRPVLPVLPAKVELVIPKTGPLWLVGAAGAIAMYSARRRLHAASAHP